MTVKWAVFWTARGGQRHMEPGWPSFAAAHRFVDYLGDHGLHVGPTEIRRYEGVVPW